jgi:hypothetical protein
MITQKVSAIMTDFIIKKFPWDLSSLAGLALIGYYFKSSKLKSLLDSARPIRAGIANSDVLKSYIALLSLGKNEFDAIEDFRGNDFFKRALDLRHVPSSPTLRQCFDSFAAQWFNLIPQINHKLLSQRVDGYCPFAVYLGSLGYCLEFALRPGKRECIWHESLELPHVGSANNPVRRVSRLTERTIDKHGVILLLPDYVLEGRTMVCQLAAVAMNLLRMIGQNTLNAPDSPIRHTAKRRRIRTVMHEMMFKAARMIRHAGRWILGLGESSRRRSGSAAVKKFRNTKFLPPE